jgi:2-amino-4-hydroxy-6-hydroxymethyldihydropteridine diphosphokinase
MQNIAYLGVGSNMGDRSNFLYQSIVNLQNHEEIEVITSSSIFETKPVGYTNQDYFLNMVIKVRTSLNPHDLLRVAQEIERKSGRKREIRWGPRTLDLDILLYNQENIVTDDLIIPHPRMAERAFVLIPLLEIEEPIDNPYIKIPVSSSIDELQEREGVRLWKRRSGEDVLELFEN